MTNYIGIDVGKNFLQVYLPSTANSFIIKNDLSGLKKLLSILDKHHVDLLTLIVVFEPTGGYEVQLKNFLMQYKIRFSTVHPNKVRSFAKAKGLLAKTNKIDSKLIHDYAASFNLQIKPDYSTDTQRSLHSLIKRREQIILFKNQEIARLDKQMYSIVIKSINQHLKYLDKQLESLKQTSEEEIKEKISRLTSIPGVE